MRGGQGPRGNQQGRKGHRFDSGRGYKRVSPNHVEVYDLDMAAWLHLHTIPIAEAFKSGRATIIVFLDPEDQDRINTLAVDWLNSEAAKFASAVRQLKKVTFATQRERR